jgi:hypothetical protein
MGRDSTGGIASGYGLGGLDRIPVGGGGGGEFFRTCPNRPWAHPASYTMGTGSFPGVKQPGRGVNHPPHSAEDEERVQLCVYSSSVRTKFTGDSRCLLALRSKRSLLVIVRSGANMLAVFLPNGVSPNSNTRSHVKWLIFLSSFSVQIITEVRPAGNERFHADQQTDRQARLASYRDSANAPTIRSGYVLRCSCTY